MDLTEGKNFVQINKFGVSYDLFNPSLGKEHAVRIYGKYDLRVDQETTESPKDFWMVMGDLDGVAFAQPMGGDMLAVKLMTGGYVPCETSQR